MNLDDLRPLATEIHDHRPDWDLRGILGVLWELRDRGTLEQLTAAAMRATRNPTSRTPAAISFDTNWRPAEPAPAPGPLPYDPLPECATCAHPVTRDDAEQLATCPACGQPWVAYQVLRWTPEHPDPDTTAAAAVLERLRANVGAARATLGHLPVDTGDDTAARAITCPWCHARPGHGCVSPATGRPLKLTAGHPARHYAAGVGPPRIALDELATRRAQRDRALRRPPITESDDTEQAAE